MPPTAEMAGLSVRNLWQWIKTKSRDAVLVATKVAGAASGWFVPPIRQWLQLSTDIIETAVEGSLRRLGVDYIDYQVHRPDTVVPMMNPWRRLIGWLNRESQIPWNIQRLSLWCQSQHRADYEGWSRFRRYRILFLAQLPFHGRVGSRRQEKYPFTLCSGGGVLSGKTISEKAASRSTTIGRPERPGREQWRIGF